VPEATTGTSATIGAAPTMPKLSKGDRGVNVSSDQGTIDWKKVADSDVRFAIVRASIGGEIDKDFARNYDQAQANGLRTGAYHRIEPIKGTLAEREARARKEAQVFIESVRDRSQQGDLIPAVDVEPPLGGLTPAEVVEHVELWTRAVEDALGVKAMIYTDADEWQKYAGDSRALAANGHPLWIADVDNHSPELPAGNWDGSGWVIWQRTEREDIPGINTIVDLNVFGAKEPDRVLLSD
jgi:lysozyme